LTPLHAAVAGTAVAGVAAVAQKLRKRHRRLSQGELRTRRLQFLNSIDGASPGLPNERAQPAAAAAAPRHANQSPFRLNGAAHSTPGMRTDPSLGAERGQSPSRMRETVNNAAAAAASAGRRGATHVAGGLQELWNRAPGLGLGATATGATVWGGWTIPLKAIG
jgi:hypothetical protein